MSIFSAAAANLNGTLAAWRLAGKLTQQQCDDMDKLIDAMMEATEQAARANERLQCRKAVCGGCRDCIRYDDKTNQHVGAEGRRVLCSAQAIRSME